MHSRRSSDSGLQIAGGGGNPGNGGGGMRSRRSSFVGGANRSITDSSRLPMPTSTPASSPQLPQEQSQQQKKPSAEEDAAMAAYDAIINDIGTVPGAKGSIGVDGLHSYLSRFGLLSREALSSELRVTAPPETSPSPANSLRSPTSSSSPTIAASGSVAKTDFIDFICGEQHHKMNSAPKGLGGAAARERRDTEGAGWIETAIERHNQNLKRQQQMQRKNEENEDKNRSDNINNNNAGGGANGGRVQTVSIDDTVQLDQTSDDFIRGSDDGDGEGGEGVNHLDTLAAIEAKLRAALDARASTPVPPALRLPHENAATGNASPGSNRGSTPSPAGAGRRRAGGYMNSASIPASRGYSPKVSRASGNLVRSSTPGGNMMEASFHNSDGGASSSGAGASSPSAILRRHQQAQLEALLAVRRSGGRLLQQRSAKRNPGSMAGFTVVKGKS